MLFAQDMGRAVKFYTGVFGFQEGFVTEHWSELLFGDAIIAFHGGGDGTSNPTGLSIQVDDADAYAKSIQVNGGMILDAPVQREGEPIKLGTFRDPEGNEVMLTEWVGELD
ncbi:MAG TPA: VOC family protein [Candidatus Saccharimonadia bacterium]|nr:VOC family protein [Candidatus Saccharimonadia bacterium]